MKPTQESIENYCSQLEKLLAAQNWKIELTTTESPFKTFASKHEEQEEWWFDDVIVTLANGEKITMFACFAGLTTIQRDKNKLFVDAYQLQNAIYSKLNLQPRAHRNLQDPYWKLWDHVD